MPKKNHKTRYADPNGYRFKGKVPLRQKLQLNERDVAALLEHPDIKTFVPESDANIYNRCAVGKEIRADIAKSLNVSDIGLKVMICEIEQKILMQALYLGIVKPVPLKPTKQHTRRSDSDFEIQQADTLAREDEG